MHILKFLTAVSASQQPKVAYIFKSKFNNWFLKDGTV